MISVAEYVELIYVIFIGAWTAYQQWLHNNYDKRYIKVQKKEDWKEKPKESVVIYDNAELDLRKQRRIQEEKKQEVMEHEGTGK